MAVSETLEACANKTDVYGVIEKQGAGNSDYIAIPAGVQFTIFELIPTGSARVEVTFDSVVAEAGDAGVAWPDGDVAVRTQARLNAGGAFIRVVNSSGDSKLFIRGVLA
jgi:hypothetical protein